MYMYILYGEFIYTRMLASVALILLFTKCFLCGCIYKDESTLLACENEYLGTIVREYSSIKKDVKIAYIENCNLSEIPANGIPFENLKELHLTCDVEELKMESLHNLVNIEILDLKNNWISQVPNNFYSEFKNLVKLDLSGNLLRNPTIDSLYYLSDLRELNLGFNRISSIDLAVLGVTPKIETLLLNNNGIYTLPLGVFDTNEVLKTLNLAHNFLQNISLGIFDNNPELQYLNLSFNLLEELPLGLFDESTKLSILDLSNNKIKNFELGIFDPTTKLTELNLGGNIVGKINLGLFDLMNIVETIKLSNMKLDLLPSALFNNNVKLKELDLSLNSLSTLPEELFKMNNNLEFLNVSSNAINSLPLKLFQQTSLKVIDISYNYLEGIEPNLLNMKTLERVYARNNHIYHLDSSAFATIGNALKFVDVRNNRLARVSDDFFKLAPNLEVFEIIGNPWDCKCFDELLEVLQKRFIEYSKEDYFQGTRSSCIVFNTFECANNVNDIRKYYEEFNNLVMDFSS